MGRPLPASGMTDPFRLAARAYLAYGVVYWIGGVYLAWHGVGVRGGRMMQAGVAWIVLAVGGDGVWRWIVGGVWLVIGVLWMFVAVSDRRHGRGRYEGR